MKKNKLPLMIWTLGLISLLMDISSELIHALLPAFLITVVGASITQIGFIEGIGESIVLIAKVFSGPISDFLRKQKVLILFGYCLSVLSKPFFALGTTIESIFFARVFDRLGKGIREAPRDALISHVVPRSQRSQAFGLRQSLDNIGAVLGPLLGMYLIVLLNDDFKTVFWISVIPGIIALLLIYFGVKDQAPISSDIVNMQISFASLRKFNLTFYMVCLFGFFLVAARISEAFLLLRSQSVGLTLEQMPLTLIVINIVYALTAYPAGKWADQIGKRKMILFSFSLLFLSHLLLAFSQSLELFFVACALWGLHMGLSQSPMAALIANTSPSELRGSAYGFFNLVSASSVFMSNFSIGYIWQNYSFKSAYLIASFLALITMIIFYINKHLLDDEISRFTDKAL